MRKFLLISAITALLLTACTAPQGKTTVIQKNPSPVPTEFVLSSHQIPKKKPDIEQEEPSVEAASSVEEEVESSVFVSLKEYMELHDLPSKTAAEYAGYIEKYANKYERDPFLILAIIHVETGSEYKNNTTPNSHTAVGLMQMLERNLECNNTKNGCYNDVWTGYTKEDLKKPDRNIELGVSYLKYLQDRFGDELGVTAYNQGEGNVAKGTYRTWYYKKVMKALDCIKEGKENRY